ncbi:hypothetical protein F7725_029069 [Dissostichus mawsoni]|uniref:2-oxo-4-hydroxy-4-carboxy-5-ureidoimidazoline decarboxylase n=1 Tax=Dissostichus mawsoni TaxID=36200 RepID=A0A7J5XHW2_DISMA|nr:hypothetical protein F7725_029069 [Dissostichus mawsoni]
MLQKLVQRSFKHCPTSGESPCMNMDIATVNALPYEDFVDILGNVVEKCPMITAAVWSGRPFLSLAALEAAIREFIDALPESDLQSGSLTRESHEEQAGSGMGALNSGEASRMARLNQEYKERFGFPFVICARMHDKENILRQLSARCQNERAVERARGIEEVKKICHLRGEVGGGPVVEVSPPVEEVSPPAVSPWSPEVMEESWSGSVPLPLLRSSSFFHFMRRFWNQILMCLSVRLRFSASSTRRGLEMYLLNRNSFSSSSSWARV